MLVHLTLDIFCFSKLTVFLHPRSRKTDEARRQIFPAYISHQMEAVVYMIIGYHVIVLFGVNKFIRSTKSRNYVRLLQYSAEKNYECLLIPNYTRNNVIINLQIYTKIKQNKSKGKEKKEQEYQIMQTVDSMRLIFSEVD